MNALKETKKKHLLAILKYLYLHNSSTTVSYTHLDVYKRQDQAFI